MNTVIWILQGLIALMFAMAGIMKLSKSKEELKKQGSMAWVSDVSSSNIKLIGSLEILAAIGLIVPQLTGILSWLTPLAAVGLAFTMIGALALHLRRGDGKQAIIPNAMLLLIAAFIAYSRFVLVPA
jgi:uncharacterized membrane protein YphA (DoxX/SURF4 family)